MISTDLDNGVSTLSLLSLFRRKTSLLDVHATHHVYLQAKYILTFTFGISYQYWGCPCLPCWFIGKQIHIDINIKYLISTLRPASWIFHTPTTITDFDFEQDLQMSWIVATILKLISRLSDSQKCAPKCSQKRTTLNRSYYTVYTGADVRICV